MRGSMAAGGRPAPCLMLGYPPRCTPPPGTSSLACWGVEPVDKSNSTFLCCALLYVGLVFTGPFVIQPICMTTYLSNTVGSDNLL